MQEESEGVLVGSEVGKTASHEGVEGERKGRVVWGFGMAANDGVEGEERRGRE